MCLRHDRDARNKNLKGSIHYRNKKRKRGKDDDKIARCFLVSSSLALPLRREASICNILLLIFSKLRLMCLSRKCIKTECKMSSNACWWVLHKKSIAVICLWINYGRIIKYSLNVCDEEKLVSVLHLLWIPSREFTDASMWRHWLMIVHFHIHNLDILSAERAHMEI